MSEVVSLGKFNDSSVGFYLEQVSHVPFLANHVVVSFTATNLRWLTVNENLLDYKAHATEAVSIAVLPDRVVIDFVHAIDETYLRYLPLKSTFYHR